jgi:hypothetical protein
MDYSPAQTSSEETPSPSEHAPLPVATLSESDEAVALAVFHKTPVTKTSHYHTEPEDIRRLVKEHSHTEGLPTSSTHAPFSPLFLSDSPSSEASLDTLLASLGHTDSLAHESLAHEGISLSKQRPLAWWAKVQGWVYETVPFLTPIVTPRHVRHALDATLKRAKEGLHSGEYLPFQATEALMQDMAHWLHHHGKPSPLNWCLFQKHLQHSIRVDWHQRLLQSHIKHTSYPVMAMQTPSATTREGILGFSGASSHTLTRREATKQASRKKSRPQSLMQAYLAKHAHGVAPIDGWMDGLQTLLQEESTCLLHPILVDTYEHISLEVQVWEKLLKEALPVAQQEAVLLAMLQKLFLPLTRALLEQHQAQSLRDTLYPRTHQSNKETPHTEERYAPRTGSSSSSSGKYQAPSVSWDEYRLLYRLLQWMQKSDTHPAMLAGTERQHVEAMIQACFQGELPAQFETLVPPTSGRVVLLHWEHLSEETLMMFKHVLLTYQRTQKQTIQSLLRWQTAVIMQRENFQTIAAHWWLQTFQQMPHSGLTHFLLSHIQTWIPQLTLPTFQGILQCFTRPNWYGMSVMLANTLEPILQRYKVPYQWEKLFKKEATHLGLVYQRSQKVWVRVKPPASRTANPWFFMPAHLAATYADVLKAWQPDASNHQEQVRVKAHRALQWPPSEGLKALCEDEPRVIETWLILWLQQWHLGEVTSRRVTAMPHTKREGFTTTDTAHPRLMSVMTVSPARHRVWVTNIDSLRQALQDDFSYQQWLKQWIEQFKEATQVAQNDQRPLISVIHHADHLFAPLVWEQPSSVTQAPPPTEPSLGCYTVSQQAAHRRHQGFVKLLMRLTLQGESMHPTQPVLLKASTPILCVLRASALGLDVAHRSQENIAHYLQEPYKQWQQWLSEKSLLPDVATSSEHLLGLSPVTMSLSGMTPRFGLSWSSLDTQAPHVTQAMQWSLSDLTRYLRWYLESLLAPEAFSAKVILEWDTQLPEHLAQYYYQKQWFLDAIHQHLTTSVLKPILQHGVKHWHNATILRVTLRMNEHFMPISASHWSLLPHHAQQTFSEAPLDTALAQVASPSVVTAASERREDLPQPATRKYLQPQILTLAWDT